MKLTNNIVTRNIREWVTLSLILFGFFYLTGDPATSAQETSGYSVSSQTALESADSNEPVSNDFSGSNKPVEHTSSIIVAVDAVSLFGKSSEKKFKANSDFANQSPGFDYQNTNEFKNTLSLVDSDLANSFTLVGQKPSGTS